MPVKKILYSVYIIRCADDSLYTGMTTDVTRRFAEHQAGKGGSYTRSRSAVQVVYTEKVGDRSQALRREAEIKRLTRSEKIALIGRD